MLYRSQLRTFAAAALIGSNTMAGSNVFEARDWPTTATAYPAILLECYRERKESRAKGSQLPQFIATAVLSIKARVQATGGEPGGLSVQELLEQFEWQIESAILTCQPLLKSIRRFAWVDTDQDINSQGQTHIGQLALAFGLEFEVDIDPYLQRPAALPPLGAPLTGIDVTFKVPTGTPQPGLIIDLPQQEQ
jgi:hypothetical protein